MSLRRDRDLASPVPTRFSRATQIRLVLILGVLAAAFAIVHEATRPIWSRWGAGEALPPPLTAEQIEALQVPVSDNDLAEDWSLPPERLRRLIASTEAPQGVDAEVDRRWRSVIGRLSPEGKFELLQTLLAATGELRAPDGEPTGTFALSPETLAKLHTDWEAEHADLSEMLAGADENDANGDGARIARTVRDTASRQLDALAQVGTRNREADSSDGESSTQRSETLAPVRRAWDRAALAAVMDATPNGHPGDFALWYRLFQRFAHVSDESLRQAAGERVTEAALASQPDAHRGELFTLVGTARGGKSVKALPNVLGIDRYYVIWVQPDDDRDALIAVYSLSKPEGFPELPEQSDLVRFALRVEAPVYFLKKLVYESQDAISVSPLVLARSFRFEPLQPELAGGPPSPAALAVGTGFAAAIGIGIVIYVYRKTRRDPQSRESAPDRIDEAVLRKHFVESP